MQSEIMDNLLVVAWGKQPLKRTAQHEKTEILCNSGFLALKTLYIYVGLKMRQTHTGRFFKFFILTAEKSSY